MMATLRRPNAAEYRHQIELQKRAVSQDQTGQMVGDWTTFFSPFAKIEDLAGSESWVDEQIRSIASHRITMRGCQEFECITTEWRARYRDRVYNFVNVNDVEERNLVLEILATRED